jgi:hypothetical protein
MTIADMFRAEAKKSVTVLPNLKQSAVLVSIHLSKFSIQKQDKEATRQVAQDNGSDVTRAKVVKTLLDPKRMQAINELDTEVRTYHYERTVAWGEGQARMLKNRIVTEYAAFMSQKESERQRLVDEFVAGYEQFILEDTAGLGTLAKRSDYIDPRRVARKFKMVVEYLPVPDSDHFEILGIDNHIDAIKAQLEENTLTALDGVQREISGRIRTVIEHLVERLTALNDKNGGNGPSGIANGKIVRFHGSTISNISDLADLIPALNVAGDPELDALAEQMRERLCGYDAEAIKDSPTVRAKIETEANDILSKLDGMMPSFGD